MSWSPSVAVDEHDLAARACALARVDRRLREAVADGPADLTAIAAYVLASPGKRFRAQLALAAAALGGDHPDQLDDDAVDVAGCVELFHEASLVHDDVCDGSIVRRDAPSVAAAYGVRTAVRFGIWLAGRGLALIGAIERRRRLGLGTAPLLALAEGQIRETQPCRGELGALQAHYLEVVRGKTSTLMVLACDAGARVAGVDDAGRAELNRFAGALGVAYQVLDDLRDLRAAAELGKPGGTDLANGVITWPLLEWLRVRPDALASLLDPGARPARAALHDELDRTGALRRARDFAVAELAAGRAALDNLPPAPGVAWLLDLSRLAP